MRCLLALFAACAISTLAIDDAAACGNATMADVDAGVKKVKVAEAALERGDLATAKKTAREVKRVLGEVEPIIRWDNRTEDVRPIVRRAIRIESLATSRDPKATEEEKNRALQDFEANILLRKRWAGPKEEEQKPDPTILADHAEILSRFPARTGPALMVLRTLRDKDLIGSAHAYAALARLEKGAGNADAEGGRKARDLRRIAGDRRFPATRTGSGSMAGHAHETPPHVLRRFPARSRSRLRRT